MSVLKEDDNFITGILEVKSNNDVKFTNLIVNVYIPGKGTERRSALDRLAAFILTTKSTKRFSEIIMTGDWNALPKTTLSALQNRGLSLPNEALTFNQSTRLSNRQGRCIDYPVATNSTSIKTIKVLRKYDMSDHFPILIQIAANVDKTSQTVLRINNDTLNNNRSARLRILNDIRWNAVVNITGHKKMEIFTSIANSILSETGVINPVNEKRVHSLPEKQRGP
ncbi:putative Endonuclease/exonuclease/phosphatase, putative transposon [Trachipleistophora hominis]|uniref:Putative Endonuclease/exonuclease/phosphatase, putative transposon n=1 Tax=Trachipleistophora hominis TaxID=72359 RepID=L7JSJ2_TRAHO|nr:putative Endonuclease/exonuclease/phosphatase, putative transposon [Trachipleistophora hominis]